MATSDEEIRGLTAKTTLASGDKLVFQRGTDDANYITIDDLQAEFANGGTFEIEAGDLVDPDGDVALRAVDGTGTIVNRIEAVNSATAVNVTLRAAGTDTNITLHLEGKGTGAVDLQTPVVPLVALADAATIAWNVSTQNTHATVTLGGNRTMGAPSNTQAGMTLELIVVQDGTGTRTLAYNAVYKFAGGTAPVVAAGAGQISVLRFIVLTTTQILCTGATLNLS